MSTKSPSSPQAETIDALSSHDAEKFQQQEIPQSFGSAPFEHTWSLWCIFSVLSLLSFLTALDETIITTSLPTITVAIGGASDGLYIWLAQSFIFASTAPQPLYGQISNKFGRRTPFLVAIVLFALGSGVAGGATNPVMLISGRSVQGLGAAGLYVFSDILICDLVPPRHRGPYLGAVLSTAGIGSTLSRVIGGALAGNNWRWIVKLETPLMSGSTIYHLHLQFCPSPDSQDGHFLHGENMFQYIMQVPNF